MVHNTRRKVAEKAASAEHALRSAAGNKVIEILTYCELTCFTTYFQRISGASKEINTGVLI